MHPFWNIRTFVEQNHPIMKLNNIIRNYFTFTRNERIGLYALITLIILFGVANQIIFFFEKPGVADEEKFNQLLEAFNKKQPDERVMEKRLFSFNPNTIDSLSLDSLNFPVHIKRNLLRYRLKGGYFNNKEDFKKLYGMNDSIFSSIRNYIQLKPKPTSGEKETAGSVRIPAKVNPKDVHTEKKPLNKIEINAATESELKSIYGIGDVLSSRIIKYRNLLGGYYKIDQLNEVYGLTEETFGQISSHLMIDTTHIHTMNINFTNKEKLVRHPYLSWKEVNAILNFRSQVGFIEFTSQLKDEKILNDSIYQRVYPYLRTKND